MRHQGFETETRVVVVSENPVDHVAAVTCACRPDAVAIDKRVATHDVRNAVHKIDVHFAGPITADLVNKLLSVTGGAARVRCEHNVTGISKHLGVPAIAPTVV